MTRRIPIIVFLMTVSTILILTLQLYWNNTVYKNNDRVFRSDVNDALDKSVNKLMNIRRDELALRYKKWMADTNLIIITCKYDSIKRNAVFSIKDKYPPKDDIRPPSRVTFNDIKQTSDHLSASTKTMFINSFVKNFVYYDLRDAKVYYHTSNLGRMLLDAFANDELDTVRLRRLYAQALQKRGIDNSFNFRLVKYKFEKFDSSTEDSFGDFYFTREFVYAFRTKVLVGASFANPKYIYLQKMKWVMLTSFILSSIALFCFIYTIRTMLSQKKLSLLKDDFVNNMTHELKTPVATISIAAEAIDNFQVDKEVQSTYIGIIRYQAKNLEHLIDQILTNLVNKQTIIGLVKEKVNINNVLQHVLSQSEPQFLVSKIELNLNLTSKQLIINADPVHLGNVIANLVDNAIKYGGNQREIGISLQEDNKQAIIQITNEGSEIPSDYLSKIFEPFFRVPTGNMHQVKGYGLGLSYVKDIVAQHNGLITVTSKSGLTTFILKLPLDEG